MVVPLGRLDIAYKSDRLGKYMSTFNLGDFGK